MTRDEKIQFVNMTRDEKIQFLKDLASSKKSIDSIYEAMPWDMDIYIIPELKRLLQIKRRTQNNIENLTQEEKEFLQMIHDRQLEHKKRNYNPLTR